MTTKFAVINPMNGLYIDTSTESERDSLIARMAWEFFLVHTHGAPYSVVTVNDDGSETWSSPGGQTIPAPAEIASNVADWLNQQRTE